MMRFGSLLLFALVATIYCLADDPYGQIPRTRPLEPSDALKSFDIQQGFRIELVACEPMIRSPVAIDFDEEGRLYVVEYPEYNQQANPDFKGHGCIKLLEDTDGDGKFDRATVFADNLISPVGVACWDGGVFVGVVPDLWYFKDTDGDGKADVARKVLTGFDRDKAGEAMLNSFRWGLDSRFHISTGLVGGHLRRADQPDAKPTPVRKQNIKFDPRSGDFTLTSGGAQHGLTHDDWGDSFVSENSHPIQHYMYDSAYLARNPYVESPSPLVDINTAGTQATLHRISPPEPWREVRTRLRKDKLFDGPLEGGRVFGFFTGATGVTCYRGDAWPAEYRGDLFVGEVANNLIYRAKPKRNGFGWTAERADSQREFLASRDIWFRPVQFANAPDGALYVVDMYRELIETVESMPPRLLKHVDVAGGIDRGRIYRIVPNGFQQPSSPRLGTATTPVLVALLAHPNGWHRDTASRLLYQRQDRSAVQPLRAMARTSESPLGRLHALSALASMKSLPVEDLLVALKDDEPGIRRFALQLAEQFIATKSVRDRMMEMVADADPSVRYQLAFSLGAISGDSIVSALVSLIQKDGSDPWMRNAILCSAGNCRAELFAKLAESNPRGQSLTKSYLIALARQMAAANRPTELNRMGSAVDQWPDADGLLIQDMVRAMIARSPTAPIPGAKSQSVMSALIAAARGKAVEQSAAATQRVQALRLLVRLPFAELKPIVEDCLNVRQPPAVQSAALELLAKCNDSGVPAIVLNVWPGLSPPIRATAAEVLLSRTEWTIQLLNAIASGRIPAADLDPARVQLLEKSPDETIRHRAAELFHGTKLSKRADVLAAYQKSLELNGDAAKGKVVFKNNCATCHRLDGDGEAVGPDLATMRNRGADTILINILDPNREVLPQYYMYQLTTDAGVSITGMITAESATSVTIRRADATSVTVQRTNIEQLTSTGISAMPEGLEIQIDIAAMADLLAYLVKRP